MSWLREADAEPIPGYRLVEPIGSGGFGEVWKCIAPGGIEKAIKFVYGNLNSEDGDGIRADQEQRALQRVKAVRHPFVLSMDRIEVVGGELAIVMELADKSLHDLLQEFRVRGEVGVPRRDVIRYLLDAADGLDHLIEKHNLQHLDVKPRNLFLIGDRVKVADFGLVKQVERQGNGGLMGGMSPIYGAPETFTGKISKHSDQYSLAIVYCEMVSGRRPFAGKNIRQLAVQHMSEPPDLTVVAEEDRSAVGRALAKDPTKRFASCQSFVRALAPNAMQSIETIDLDEEIERIANESHESEAPTATALIEELPIEADEPHTMVLKGPIPQFIADAEPSGIAPPDDRSSLIDAWGDAGPTHFLSNGSASKSRSRSHPAPSEISDPDAAVDLGAPPESFGPEFTKTSIAKGVLRPTLFIGLGAFGRRTLADLRCRLLDRFGDLGQIPAYRYLYIDSDPEALDQAALGTPEVALNLSETFLLPLQPVINYRRRMIDHLSVWLPKEKLHSIPRSLQPQGSRALGRLAYIDNFPRLQSRLRREIQVASHSDSIEASLAQTKLSRGKDSPRIFVFASACGGSGGSIVDLGYSLRRLLRQLNHGDSPITLHCFCGSPKDDSSSRLELTNAYATLVELNHFRNCNANYDVNFGPDGPQMNDAGAPFDAVYLASSPERSPEAFRDTVAHLATYVTQDVSSSVGPDLTKARKSNVGYRPTFRSFGTYTVWFPRGLLLRVAARRAVARLVDVWQAPAAAKTLDAIEMLCASALSDPGLRWESLSAELNRLAHSSMGSPLEATEQFLEQIDKESTKATTAENAGGWALQTLDKVRRFAGAGTGRELEALWKKSVFYKELARASQQLGEQWDSYLFEQLGELIRRPGHRLATTEAGIRKLVQFCEKAIRAQWDAIEKHYQNMKRIREDFEAAAQGCQGGVKILFGGTNRAIKAFVDQARVFARQRIVQDLLESGVQFFMTLQGRLEDRLRDIGFARQRLKTLKQILSTPIGGQPTTQSHFSRFEHSTGLEIVDPFWEVVQGTATVQVVLPAGVSDLEQSADQFVQSLQTEHWLALDETLQTEVLAPLGDLHNAATVGSDIADYFGRPLVEQAATQLGTVLPITDVAQVEFSSAESNGMKLEGQLRRFLAGATPLVRGEGREETFVLVPESEAGQAYGQAAHNSFPNIKIVPVANPIELTILREQGELDAEVVEELFTNAKRFYQEVVGVPALSPHSRFDVNEWRPLSGQHLVGATKNR